MTDIIADDSIEKINSIDHLFGNYYAINDLIPIQINAISTLFEYGDEIDITDEKGSLLGCICTPTKDFKVPIEIFTLNRFVAYLADVSYSDYISHNYVQKNSYAVIIRDRIYEYLKLSKTSSIWGGYYHNGNSSHKLEANRKKVQSITAIEKLDFPTDIHFSNSINALMEPFVFERFLKKYHQIELLSDLDVVQRIKKLDEDLYGIGELLSEIDSNELNRFRIIMSSRIQNVELIVKGLELVRNYPMTSRTIFQKYNKKGNPISDNSEFNKFVELTDFKEATLKKNFRKNLHGEKYKDFIIQLSSYWVYRIRCSIAHKRIGEYVMNPKDEDFMVDFGEPLIDSIVITSFKKAV